MPTFTQGQEVSQVITAPITGTVEKFSFDENTGEIVVLVSYKDADGNDQQRYFKETEIAAV
jgi:type II secretory pathway component PulL